MEFIQTAFEGLFIIQDNYAADQRGAFIKTFNENEFQAASINFELKEQYYSLSNKNVVRGMHFQLPPYDHSKLIYVINGSVLDVVLDLRKNSSTFGKAFSIVLPADSHKSLFIPKGFAHGFKALENQTLMMYNVSSVYNRENDSGIAWDSFGFDWEIENPIMSERDTGFITFDAFQSPF